ncbi:hypothetical protein [Streptomyces sp. CL12]|uniref:hypothetical protein n=1 Tax=Streptomyces sp. CL12 TaxID=3391744 RepID=UPI003A80B237
MSPPNAEFSLGAEDVDRRVAARPARARGTVGDALEAIIGAEALEDIADGVFRYSGP